MKIENIGSSIPEFKYIPTAKNLDQITESVRAGELDPEKEAAEIAHLKFDLGIDTVKLFEDLKKINLEKDIRKEIELVIGLVAASERELEVQQLLLSQIEGMTTAQAQKLIDISLNIKNARKKSQN